MTITANVPSLPTTAPSRTQSQIAFDAAVDNFLSALPAVVSGINTVIGQMNNEYAAINNAVATSTAQAAAALAQATISLAQAAIATTQATNATSQANIATAQANIAANTLTQTQAARDQALAGLGAADNSQILSVLMGEGSFLNDMIGQAIKELYRYEGVTDPKFTALEPGMDVIVQTIVDLADLLGVVARAISGGDVIHRLGTVDNPSISYDGNRNTGIYSPGANQLAVTTAGVQRLLIDAVGNHLAGTDNAQTLGSAAKRWSTVYAGTGTINTSDAREKTAVAALTADEIAAAKDLSKEVGTYQFLDSIAAKGAGARHHIGLTVQRAIEIMQGHNLDPMRYGFICHDAWPEISVQHPAIDAKPEVLDADGNVVELAVAAKDAWTEVISPSGDRYSFRYDQLNLFISAGLNARLITLGA